MNAQAPPVPSTFQDLYTELGNYLDSFNVSLGPGNGSTFPTLLTGSLKAANSNIGPQLLNATSGMQLQLNALKAMGAQAIMVQVGFPMLYEPFLTSQSQSYQDFVTYYQNLAAAVRQAGLKLIVENDTLLSNDVSAGWDVAPFYATLNWTQYQQARAQTALTVAQVMQPDYMVVLEEPNTEYGNSGQSQLVTPSGSAAMLSQILASVQQAGVPGLKVGAGTATATVNALSYIQQFVTLPVDFIDMHIYPINNDYLQTALQIASIAAAAGKAVGMTECWLWKARDSEINVLTPDQFRARDPFSFWAPLDAYFVQTMQNLANYTQMLFLNPFGAEYYFAYLPYDDSTENLTISQILDQESAMASANTQQAHFTSTAMSYYNSVVVPADTTPPSAPSGLSGVSGNPTTAHMSWTAATDNVGVAGYNVFRDGEPVGTTASLNYQDTGLTEATTYTYTIKAFDLGGNVSEASAPFPIQTSDETPPSPPGNVVARAISCTRATLTWSASTDEVGVTQYQVFIGLSPDSLTYLASTNGTATSYGNSTLSPAATYYFGIVALDRNQNTSYMSSVVPVTTPALPVAPVNLSAQATSTTKISLTWSASTGGLPIAHYLVYRGSSPSTLSQVAATSKTCYTDTSVAASTTYYYAVQAADTGTPPAQSGISAPVAVTTFSPPAVPANLAATPNSCTKVGLTWSPAVSGGLPIANYRVYKGTSATNLSQVVITTKTSYTDTADLAQTTYYYAVQSADTGAPPALSETSTPVAVTTYGYPSVPGNFTGTALSSSRISLAWSASASGGLPIAKYKIYRGTSPSGVTQQVGVTTSTSYTNSSLTAGTTYYYAVQATDTGMDNSALSDPVQVTTLHLPTTPANVAAQAASSTQIGVSWSPSSGDLPIAHYFIFRGDSPSTMSQVATTTKTSYNDRSLSAGTTYYYGVQAADTAQGLSPRSPAVPVTTQP